MAEISTELDGTLKSLVILDAADKAETPAAGTIAGPYRKTDGTWYERRSDGTEVKLFGDSSEVVYKAAAAASEANKVNAYPKAADIGAAPAVVKGAVYSTFTLDTGSLSSYVANTAGTAWVPVAGGATADAWKTLTIAADKQSVYTLSPAITSTSPLVTLNGQEIEATVNAAGDKLTIVDTDVIAIIETSDVLRVRG